MKSVVGLMLCGLFASLSSDTADIGGSPPPSFEQWFAQSEVVAVARIELGAIGSHSSQIYRARIEKPIKGATKNNHIFFWGGNVGTPGAYGLGEVYLLMVRSTGRKLTDVLTEIRAKDEPLYEAVCLNAPIPSRTTDTKGPLKRVFVFWRCIEPPVLLHPLQVISSRGENLGHWTDREQLIEYLEKLAAAEQTKFSAGT